MKTNIKDKKGNITAYGYACGYITIFNSSSLRKEIYKENNIYNVRSSINSSPELHTKFDGTISHIFTIWEPFDNIKAARKFYSSIK